MECSNGVIVTVYEESAKVDRSSNHGNDEKMRVRNSKPIRKSRCYDRRAELLAYSHHLRNAGTQQIHQDQNPINSMPKPKKRRRLFGQLRRFRVRFGQLFGGKKSSWRYESMGSQGNMRKYRSCHPGRNKWSKMSQRLRRFLKEISPGCKCTKRP